MEVLHAKQTELSITAKNTPRRETAVRLYVLSIPNTHPIKQFWIQWAGTGLYKQRE